MAGKIGKGFAVLAAGLFMGALFLPSRSGAIEVKKKLNLGGGETSGAAAASQGPAPKNPLSAAQRNALQDSVANDSEVFVGQESEKKASGEPYIDIEHAKFSYIPTASSVTAKLEAPEYKLRKGGEGKGNPTGNKKALVFKYKLEGSKLVPDGEAKWEDIAAAKKK